MVFPFGFGLSYTTFGLGTPTVQPTADGWDVVVPVTNTGNCAGKEVVQLYVGRQGKSAVSRPLKELKDFGKTALLKPGQTQELRLHVGRTDLAYWDESTHGWQTEAGKYTFYVATSSADPQAKKVNIEF